MNPIRRRLLFPCVAALAVGAALPPPARAQGVEDITKFLIEMVDNTRDVDTRVGAIRILGTLKLKEAAVINVLIARYEDPKDPALVQRAAHDALELIAGAKFGSPEDAKKWWAGNRGEIEKSTPPARQLEQLARDLDVLRDESAQFKIDLDRAGTTMQILFVVNLSLNLLFVVVIIAFGVMAGSRLKAMREASRQAERYISSAEEVHKRFDGIVNEIVAKKTEVLDFFHKMKEEHQAEIERYAELLEQNMEHRMREETMGLRLKGEKELEGTLQQLKGTVNEELQRLAAQQKEAIGREFQAQERHFLQEVESQTLFLEAALAARDGRHEDAVRLLKRAVEKKPGHHLAWAALGRAQAELGRFTEAHEAYAKALEAAPGDPHVLYHVAATHARQRHREKMLETLALTFQNDGELKDEAMNDPAFKEYWRDPAFKDLAET